MKIKYKQTGYKASTQTYSGTNELMQMLADLHDQRQAKATRDICMGSLRQHWKVIQTKAMMFIGNSEQPKVQMQWNMDRFPPSSCALREITTDPIQTRQKTIPKMSLAACPTVPFDKVHDREIHKTKGPQRSQFFSFLVSPKGIITILTLLSIYLISLTRLRNIDSSKV